MIKLAVMNQKGGVGKTFFACQFAFYCALKRGLRVLVIDLDAQMNTSRVFEESPHCAVSSVKAADMFFSAAVPEEDARLLLVAADPSLNHLERRGETMHNKFVSNFYSALENVENKFDICVIDTLPGEDVRALSALIVATHAVSPLELARESIDGVVSLFANIQRAKILNKSLDFIGLIPNRVENSPGQKATFREISSQFGKLLIKNSQGHAVAVAERTAIREAQNESRPIWEGQKSTAQKTWAEVRKVMDTLAERLELPNASSDEIDVIREGEQDAV